MKIEIWSDVYCPFCYIGEANLKQAMAKYPEAKNIELEFKSFELDPSIDEKYDTTNYVAKKYNITDEQARKNYEGIVARGKEAGVDFDFDKAIIVNTFDAHRLINFAKTKNLMIPIVDRLFKAHFKDGLDVSDHTTLITLAAEVGLAKEETKQMLESNNFSVEVKTEEQEGALLGVRSVPFFVFDRKFALTGAQPVESFENALEKAFGLTKGFEILNSDEDSTCGPNGCTF